MVTGQRKRPGQRVSEENLGCRQNQEIIIVPIFLNESFFYLEGEKLAEQRRTPSRATKYCAGILSFVPDRWMGQFPPHGLALLRDEVSTIARAGTRGPSLMSQKATDSTQFKKRLYRCEPGRPLTLPYGSPPPRQKVAGMGARRRTTEPLNAPVRAHLRRQRDYGHRRGLART